MKLFLFATLVIFLGAIFPALAKDAAQNGGTIDNVASITYTNSHGMACTVKSNKATAIIIKKPALDTEPNS